MFGRFVVLAAAVLTAAACNFDKLPTAGTPIAAPSPPFPTPPLPTTVPGVLSLGMPIDGAEPRVAAFGMLPFGYHGGGHTDDGHAGWDIEYRLGASVRAAAGGTVFSVDPDPNTQDASSSCSNMSSATHFYRTHYANLGDVNSEIVVDEFVLARTVDWHRRRITATIGDAPRSRMR